MSFTVSAAAKVQAIQNLKRNPTRSPGVVWGLLLTTTLNKLHLRNYFRWKQITHSLGFVVVATISVTGGFLWRNGCLIPTPRVRIQVRHPRSPYYNVFHPRAGSHSHPPTYRYLMPQRLSVGQWGGVRGARRIICLAGLFVTMQSTFRWHCTWLWWKGLIK